MKLNKEKPSVQKLVFLGLMVALSAVLGMYTSITVGNIRISPFGFLPIAMVGYLLGPASGALTGLVVDIVNFLLINHRYGPLNLGLTLTAALTGLWFGLILYNQRISIVKSIFAIVPVIVVAEIGMNSFFLYLGQGANPAFWGAEFPKRVLTNALECPVKVALLWGMGMIIKKIPKGMLESFKNG